MEMQSYKSKTTNSFIVELVGESSEEKPIKDFNGMPLATGSTYLERDTGEAYMYDNTLNDWQKIGYKGEE